MLKVVIFLLVGLCVTQSFQYSIVEAITDDSSYSFESKNLSINVEYVGDRAVYSVRLFDRIMQRVRLNANFGRNFTITDTKNGFILRGIGQNIEFTVEENTGDFALVKVSRTLNADQRVDDCFELETARGVHWFGGPQIFYQYWPVEKFRFEEYSYVTKQQDNVGVAERYWLNSKGGFIYVDEKVPLFLNQNVDGNTLCFTAKLQLPYNVRSPGFKMDYRLGVGRDAKMAQKKAVEKFLKKPTGLPDRRMVEHPIWSTWAKYQREIDETIVNDFADEILKHGFNNSQFEIDDDWEVCYGALKFRDSKFKDIRKLTDYLKSRGFRVTLWIHPFINKGCDPWYTEAKTKGYLVADYKNNTDTIWWNSEKDQAAYIDFTKPEAAKWYSDRLSAMQKEAGIDSFKFDAGESSWLPPDPKLNAPLEEHPLAITKTYIRTVAKFGPIVEVRSGHGTQDLAIFVRMLDKDTEWNFRNGLPTLITTLIQMNMVGYTFILPDMIGGNAYNTTLTKELFIRWLQANVFMPSLQFSYVPWDFDDETIEISRNFTRLHAEYTDEIMAAMKKSVDMGEPVNPPIWWLDPNDQIALGISDEFLLGDRILSAPVINKDDNYRHVYLPRGKWYDPNQNKEYRGPTWLMDYPAPLNVLPYFIRKD